MKASVNFSRHNAEFLGFIPEPSVSGKVNRAMELASKVVMSAYYPEIPPALWHFLRRHVGKVRISDMLTEVFRFGPEWAKFQQESGMDYLDFLGAVGGKSGVDLLVIEWKLDEWVRSGREPWESI